MPKLFSHLNQATLCLEVKGFVHSSHPKKKARQKAEVKISGLLERAAMCPSPRPGDEQLSVVSMQRLSLCRVARA